MYDFTRQELHQQALCCTAMQTMLDGRKKELDKRTHKPCWGFRCFICNHETACRTGMTEDWFVIKPEHHHLVKESHKHVRDFDGNSIDTVALPLGETIRKHTTGEPVSKFEFQSP